MNKYLITGLCLLGLTTLMSGCFSAKSASASGRGGEVVGKENTG